MSETTPDWMHELNALIDRAEREGKWLHCGYQDLWFSPKQLRDANARGSFRWGPANWTLRDPAERLVQADRAVAAAKAERDRIAAEVAQ